MHAVKSVDQIDPLPMAFVRDIIGMGVKVLDGVGPLGKNGRTLSVGRQKGRAPILRSVGSETPVVGKNHEGR